MESSYEQPVLSIIHYQLTFMNHYQPTIHPRLNIMNYQPSLSNIHSLLTNIHPLFTHYSRMISPPSRPGFASPAPGSATLKRRRATRRRSLGSCQAPGHAAKYCGSSAWPKKKWEESSLVINHYLIYYMIYYLIYYMIYYLIYYGFIWSYVDLC